MAGSDLKSDTYTIGQAAGNNNADIVCSDANGNVLFKVTGDQASHQFVDNDGKTIGQVKQDQQARGLEIYDASNKLVGSVSQQQQNFALNDASNKAIAIATRGNNSNGFNITSPDSKTNIATMSVQGNAQQGRGGLAGGLLNEMGMGGMMGGMGGRGMQNSQNAQKRFSISVQNQSLPPLLLLAFAYSLSRQPGTGGQQKRGGMGGLGGGGLLGAGMILGGLAGGLGGGRGGFGRI